MSLRHSSSSSSSYQRHPSATTTTTSPSSPLLPTKTNGSASTTSATTTRESSSPLLRPAMTKRMAASARSPQERTTRMTTASSSLAFSSSTASTASSSSSFPSFQQRKRVILGVVLFLFLQWLVTSNFDELSGSDTDGRVSCKGIHPRTSINNTTNNNHHHPWDISPMWAHQCVRVIRSNRTIMSGWPQKYDRSDHTYPREYRLGDCVKVCECAGIGVKPNETSLAQYHYRACVPGHHTWGGNLTVIQQILEEQADRFEKPDADTLVIHLRLGDVVELSNSSIEEMLRTGGEPEHLGLFPKALKSVPEYLENIHEAKAQKVEIVGGTHHLEYYHKSIPYAHCMLHAFRCFGLDASMRLNYGSPDSEFYYMSYAKQIIVSAGGFSRLLGQMAVLNGGRIIGRFFNITQKG